MGNLLKKFWSTGIVGTFLAGLLVFLPVALTLIILNWLSDKIASVLGPGSLFGELLVSGGTSILGQQHSTASYLLGLVIALLLIWIIGVVVKSQTRQQLHRGIDGVFERMPFIRGIYKPVAQIIRLMGENKGDALKGMSVVSCNFEGLDLLGLATSQRSYLISGREMNLVYIPTSPLPLSGGLVLVPVTSVIPMPAISVDELFKIYLSLGVVIPDSILEHSTNI